MATTTELQQTVEDAAAHLYVWALKDIPQDLRDALLQQHLHGARLQQVIRQLGLRAPNQKCRQQDSAHADAKITKHAITLGKDKNPDIGPVETQQSQCINEWPGSQLIFYLVIEVKNGQARMVRINPRPIFNCN
jgi:hypothetical protein